MENEKNENQVFEKLEAMENGLVERIGNVESSIADITKEIKEASVDDVQAFNEQLAAYIRGDVDMLDSELLRTEVIGKLVPADFGRDYEQLFYLKPTNAMSTTVGLHNSGALSTSASATAFDPDAQTISLKNHGMYSTFSASEADSTDISVAREVAVAFTQAYNATLKAGVVTGDASYLKGVSQYSETETWEKGKVQTYEAATATVADVWETIVKAVSSLQEDGPKFVMLDSAVIAEMRTNADDGNNYYAELLKELEVDIIRNDNLGNSCETAGITVAICGVKKRAFALAKAPKLVISREQEADTRKIYMGINLGMVCLNGKEESKGLAKVTTPASGS